jgi:hypothetical protein
MNEKLSLISNLVAQSAKAAGDKADKQITKRKGSNAKSGKKAKTATSVSNVKKVKAAKTVKGMKGTGPGGLIRFQGYFRQAEAEAIRKAQMEFMQRGYKAPPENQIVRIALQTLRVDDNAVNALVRLEEEKRARTKP